ncbi:hypothetical protein AGABI1DRAFT_112479 [Agaricus bisporus var. burnettii JB137-S8]|uniref:Uncharacterized protein n=1 Tax=Agaricus bisporus var. burnettii (strain JB137-S8 / ATCC MYA-4627 / FGSC 10392) TaxID=597362 RepID=K5WYZ8_AGABU|nr:uncharacterized protein AGABI1DRAFT_112479 [Agaricus bisporus var. burnettii JB137-S8]EKM80736.1 hypothetical protein AGABI1DRAFT_112479 [Agaricus bisporus var. burnettii JB137-S8]
MAPKFCCCLPLRLGAIVISFLQFLLCGAAAGGFWYLLHLVDTEVNFDQVDHARNVRIAFIVAGSICTFGALIGLIGFFGAAFKKNGLVKTHLALLYVSLLLQVASGICSIIIFYRFRHDDETRERCIGGSSDAVKINLCNALSLENTPEWAIWVSSLVPTVVVAYACYVVHSYSRRLAQQKADDQIFPRSGPAYTPVLVTDKDESHSLSRPHYSYPYADTTHSFGNATNTPPGSGHAAGYYNHNNNHV